MQIVQIEVSEVWLLLREGYDINMVDDDNIVYYLNGVACDTVAGWLNEVENGKKKAAFFYLVA